MAHSNLDKENFDRFVSEYARKAGIDEQGFDSDAYFDSSLTYNENKENFKASFPLPDTRSAISREIRGEQVKEYKYGAEMRAAERKEAKEARREMAQTDINKAELTSSPIQEAESEFAEEERTRKKGLREKASEFIEGKKRGLKEWQEKRMKEREFKAKSKYAEYSQKARVEPVGGYNKAYEKAHNPPLNIAQGLNKARQAVRGMGNMVSGGRSRSLLFEAGNARSPLLSALTGAQPKKRGHYTTIINKGVARRVRVPDEGGEYGQTAPQTSGGLLASMTMGSGKPGGLLSLSLSERRADNGRQRGEQRSGIASIVFGGGSHKPGLSILGGGDRKSPLLSARAGGGKLRLRSGKSRLRL